MRLRTAKSLCQWMHGGMKSPESLCQWLHGGMNSFAKAVAQVTIPLHVPIACQKNPAS